MSNLILVHGAWQGAWSWEQVIEKIQEAGESSGVDQVLAPDMPGHGRRFADEIRLITMDHYVNAVVTLVAVRRLEDVVLVGHGFAATFLPRAALELRDRVKRVVFIAGELPPEGKSAYDRLSLWDKVMLRAFKAGEKGFRFPDFIFKEILFDGLDGNSARQMLSRLVPEPFLPWGEPVSREEFVDRFPTTYVVLTKDKVTRPQLQRRYIRSINPDSGRQPVTVEELDAGHGALLAHPQDIANILLKCV